MEKELALKDFINQRTAGESFKHEILGRPESKGHDLRITLITPNVIISKGQLKRVQPPLGIACIAAVLDEYNFKNIQILDTAAEGYNNVVDIGDNFLRFGLDNNQAIEKIKKFKPKVIGISALFSAQIGCAFELAKEIKSVFPDCIIFFGGIHATKKSNEILKEEKYIDYIIEGESDYTCTLFCRKIDKGESLKDIPGLVWRDRKDENIIHSNPQLPGLDMNELPFPAWHLLDMELYFDIGMPHNPFMKSREYLTVMTERGCPEKCYFCSSKDFFGGSGRFRPLTAENASAMVKYGVDKFGIKELQIEDDTFTLNSKRVVDFCKNIKKLKLRITLPNAIRADAPKNRKRRFEMFQYMADAGFAKIAISPEHGDQDFLDKVVGKRLDLDEVVATVELAHKAGLMIHSNFMMGFPFESHKNREKTINFAQKLSSDSFTISLAAPLPGTPMWDICEQHNLFMDNFDVNRLVYGIVNIKPHDISPEKLMDLVTRLSIKLNSNAKSRSKIARDHYKLFRGKSSNGARNYSEVWDAQVKQSAHI